MVPRVAGRPDGPCDPRAPVQAPGGRDWVSPRGPKRQGLCSVGITEMYRTISISVRLVVLSSVWYVTDQIYTQRVSMAAPPSKDPSRLGKGPSSHPNPPGAGAFLMTPSTTTDTLPKKKSNYLQIIC